MKKWLTMQNFGQIFKLFAFFKEKKGLISENFCYKARVKPWRFWKNWWFFGNFFEKLAQNGQILQTHFAKIPWKHWQFWWRKSTFRFSRKNRPIFKTFCQNNAKIMRNLKKKSTSVSCRNIYQGSLAFQRSKIWPFTKVYKHSRGWHPVPVPRVYPRNQSIIEEIQEL